MLSLTSVLPSVNGETTLRRLDPSDLRAFHAYRSDGELARFQGWAPMDEDQARRFLSDMSAASCLMPGQWTQLAVAQSSTDVLLGDLGLHLSDDARTVELGITLSQAAQGRGHALRALQSCTTLLRSLDHRLTVRAGTDTRNQPCRRLLLSAGFSLAGTRFEQYKGEWCEELTYVFHL